MLRLLLNFGGLCLVLSQGLPPLDSTVLVGSSSASGSLQALYGKSKAWRWAFKQKPAVACSSSAGSLCAANDGEALDPALLELATSPSYYDARFPKYTGLNYGVIGSVRDQGSCFTCAAFASIAAAEAAICSALGIDPSLLHLSEHSLAYCIGNNDGFQRTCRSPWGIQQAISALAAALKVPRKITTAKCAPYILSSTITSSASALEDTCRSNCTGSSDDPAGYLNGQLGNVTLGSAFEMQQHILAYGAAVTSMTLYDDFKAFFLANPKGVYPGPKKGAKVDQYHAVAVVGFDNDKNYWIAKNSWGKSFADGGFFRIAYGASAIASFGNMFGVTWQPVQPPAQQVDLLPISTKPGCYSYTAKPTDFISRIANRFRLSVSNILLDNRNVITDLDKPVGGKVLTLCGLDSALTPASDEQQALLQLKAQVDRLGALDDWKVDARGVLALNSSQQPVHCGWTGVGCHPETGRVIAIAISDLSLGGALPSALTLQALPDLRGFYFCNAGLTGTLPPAYSGLKSLKLLALRGNLITGPLPALWTAGLKQLEVLDLARNQLTGTLPPEVSQFGNRLQLLDVSYNWLDGRLPIGFMALTNLQTFNASGNMLTGPLPDSWARMHNLGALDLSSNNLIGTLPASWGSGMLGLTNVTLAYNQLSGTLPSSWNVLINLHLVDLRYNALTGQLPDSWSTLTKLQALQLSANALNGTLPASWGSWPSLQAFVISRNQLSGTLPKSYGNWGALFAGMFDNNLLTGPLPSEWQNMRGAYLLYLGNNRLSGSLPAAWGNGMSRLNILALSNNQLSGPLPPEWSRLPSLFMLLANHNQLSGTLPPSWVALKGLSTLLLSGNRIAGTLPAEYGLFPALASLALDCNQLTGTIPASYFTVGATSLSNNKLTGTLPQQWGLASLQRPTQLKALDVSNNMLSGPIPSSWKSLKLERLALYNNSGLTGCLPTAWRSILLSDTGGCLSGSGRLQSTNLTGTSPGTSSYQPTDRKKAQQRTMQVLVGTLLSPQRQISPPVMAASTSSSAPAANVMVHNSPTMGRIGSNSNGPTLTAMAKEEARPMVKVALKGTKLIGLC